VHPSTNALATVVPPMPHALLRQLFAGGAPTSSTAASATALLRGFRVHSEVDGRAAQSTLCWPGIRRSSAPDKDSTLRRVVAALHMGAESSTHPHSLPDLP
jgi:hypothetical protein